MASIIKMVLQDSSSQRKYSKDVSVTESSCSTVTTAGGSSSGGASPPAIGNRARTDTGDSSLSSDGSATENSSSSTQQQRKKRSHRPRGCRGGRKNRKKQGALSSTVAPKQEVSQPQPTLSLGRQPRQTLPIPSEIANQTRRGTQSPHKKLDLTVYKGTRTNAVAASSQSTTSAQQPGALSINGFFSSQMYPRYNAAPTTTSQSSDSNMTNPYTAIASLAPRFYSTEQVPSFAIPLPSSASSFNNDTSPHFKNHQHPTLYAKLGAAVQDSSTLPNNCTHSAIAGYNEVSNFLPTTTTTSGEILPPPPPSTTVSMGRRIGMDGPNPYALTAKATFSDMSHFQIQSKSYNPSSTLDTASSFMKNHFSVSDAFWGSGSEGIFTSDTSSMIASVAGGCGGLSDSNSTINTTTTGVDSLFEISPRSFLTGAKGRPASFAW